MVEGGSSQTVTFDSPTIRAAPARRLTRLTNGVERGHFYICSIDLTWKSGSLRRSGPMGEVSHVPTAQLYSRCHHHGDSVPGFWLPDVAVGGAIPAVHERHGAGSLQVQKSLSVPPIHMD